MAIMTHDVTIQRFSKSTLVTTIDYKNVKENKIAQKYKLYTVAAKECVHLVV